MMESIEAKGYDDFQKKIKSMLQVAKNPKELMGKTATKMLQDVQRHFRNSESPNGKWKALKFRKGGKPLSDTGRNLEGSLATAYTAKTAITGTNAIMAAIHNFGGTIKMKNKEIVIPKREFMWLSDTAEEQISDIFITALDKT